MRLLCNAVGANKIREKLNPKIMFKHDIHIENLRGTIYYQDNIPCTNRRTPNPTFTLHLHLKSKLDTDNFHETNLVHGYNYFDNDGEIKVHTINIKRFFVYKNLNREELDVKLEHYFKKRTRLFYLKLNNYLDNEVVTK